MREIKFRAWFPKEYYSEPHMAYLDINDDFGGASATWQLRYLQYPEIDGPIYEQYIGLKDKNGVEIYEGDVVAIDMWQGNEHGYIAEDGVICWYEESSAFKWFSLEEEPSDANNYWLTHADYKKREVIGNIHENPELLK